ncbi:hypothetical protein H5410_064603, partial [Solanum commersonii]
LSTGFCAPPHTIPPDLKKSPQPPILTQTIIEKTQHNNLMKGANTSYAGALNQNSMSQIKGKIKLPSRQHEFVDGKPVVIFTKEEQELLATTYKWTFVVKIGVEDLKHIFIDVDNEEDYNTINSKNFINLSEDNNMKIQKIVSPIGTSIVMDKATLSKTRPTTTKVRVEIDFTKTVVHEVAVEIRNSTGEIDVFNQKIEYETIPLFYFHCKIQGHFNETCKVLHLELPNHIRNEDISKDAGRQRKNMQHSQHNKNMAGKNNLTNTHTKTSYQQTTSNNGILENPEDYKVVAS